MKVDPHGFGFQVEIVNTPLYCCKLIFLLPFRKSSTHYHVKKDETFIGLRGKIFLEAGFLLNQVLLGRFFPVHIPPRSRHKFLTTDEPGLFMEVSTHHDDADTVRTEAGDSQRIERKDWPDPQRVAETGALLAHELLWSDLASIARTASGRNDPLQTQQKKKEDAHEPSK